MSKYDLVITSAGWYITRGFRVWRKDLPVGRQVKVVCYCHTPPRWLYGFETSGEYQKFWPVKIYAAVVGRFLRKYDKWSVKSVDGWIANSKNVQGRIKKFYGRKSTIIYPPVEVEKIIKAARDIKKASGPEGLRPGEEDYFLIVSRLVGAKGIEEAIKAANKLGFKLKIVGEAADVSGLKKRAAGFAKDNTEFLGRLSDKELYKVYAKAKGFIALARDEDFGITPVEAQAAGIPVIAFNGGGFRESVIDGKTGILIDDTDEKSIEKAIKRFNKIKWDKKVLQENAKRFSKERFTSEVTSFINKYARTTRG